MRRDGMLCSALNPSIRFCMSVSSLQIPSTVHLSACPVCLGPLHPFFIFLHSTRSCRLRRQKRRGTLPPLGLGVGAIRPMLQSGVGAWLRKTLMLRHL